jgi:hypothetical protein
MCSQLLFLLLFVHNAQFLKEDEKTAENFPVFLTEN